MAKGDEGENDCESDSNSNGDHGSESDRDASDKDSAHKKEKARERTTNLLDSCGSLVARAGRTAGGSTIVGNVRVVRLIGHRDGLSVIGWGGGRQRLRVG